MGTGTASTVRPLGRPGYWELHGLTTRIWNTSSSTEPTPALRDAPKKGGQAAQALGRSRGGFSTKIQRRCFRQSPAIHPLGVKSTTTEAERLQAEYVLADKGYSQDASTSWNRA